MNYWFILYNVALLDLNVLLLIQCLYLKHRKLLKKWAWNYYNTVIKSNTRWAEIYAIHWPQCRLFSDENNGSRNGALPLPWEKGNMTGMSMTRMAQNYGVNLTMLDVLQKIWQSIYGNCWFPFDFDGVRLTTLLI